MIRIFFCALSLVIGSSAIAVEPEEMLADPALEARAQALDEDIRCVQCQSENIASSNADWARDARLVVRELIVEGRSDTDIMAFFVERYGERVLMNPRKDGVNAVLWLAGPGMLILALLIGAGYVRRRRVAEAPKPLTSDEEARLKEILEE